VDGINTDGIYPDKNDVKELTYGKGRCMQK
jgi:hypothetical protein